MKKGMFKKSTVVKQTIQKLGNVVGRTEKEIADTQPIRYVTQDVGFASKLEGKFKIYNISYNKETEKRTFTFDASIVEVEKFLREEK